MADLANACAVKQHNLFIAYGVLQRRLFYVSYAFQFYFAKFQCLIGSCSFLLIYEQRNCIYKSNERIVYQDLTIKIWVYFR